MKIARRIVPIFHPFLWYTELGLRRVVWDRIFCSPEYRFIYFRVPKSANSTISLSLVRCMGGAITDDHDGTGARSKQLGRKFLSSGIIFQWQLPRFFSFTFIRNPFARVLSAYLDKIYSGDRKFLKGLDIEADKRVTFRKFLEILEGGALMANIHWAPQSSVIPVHPSRLNFVGRVESIDQDLPAVLNRIFGPGEHPVVRRTLGVRSAANRFLEYYGDPEVRLVRKLYARDFELFYPDISDPLRSNH